MSDEDANYDDFMMSDDDDAGMIEMEDETSDEDESHVEEDTHNEEDNELNKHKKRNKNNFDLQLELAKCCEDDQDFQKARKVYNDILRAGKEDGISMEQMLKSIIGTLESWSMEVHYGKISEDLSETIFKDFKKFVQFLQDNKKSLNNTSFHDNVSSLLDSLFPHTNREYLFAADLIDQNTFLLKMQLQKQCLQLLENSFGEYEELSDIVLFGKVNANLWYDRLKFNSIRDEDIDALQILFSKNECIPRLDLLCLIIQCYVYNFIEHKKAPPERLKKNIAELEEIASKSLAASQRLGLMVHLHLSKAISILVGCNSKEIQMHEFYEIIQHLREELWECLQHIEEIGGSKQNFTSIYEEFILAGFTFANIILYNTDENKINPFEFEQLKIAHDVPIVGILKDIYQEFLALNLRQLYDSMQLLGTLQDNFQCLIDALYGLAQLAKLWTKVAPVYSCISFADVQDMLKLKKDSHISRDELLTILMKSIMNNRAEVFYKLDLSKDLLYFGNENKVQLSIDRKESFQLEKKGLRDLEFANNVGIFDNPNSRKHLAPLDFFDSLQNSRDNVHCLNQNHKKPGTSGSTAAKISQSTGFQPTRMQYGNGYNELAELVHAKLII